MKVRFLGALVLSAVVVGGSGALKGAEGQEESFTRSLTVAQTAIYEARPEANTTPGQDALKVVAWVDRDDYTYAVGEPVRIWVETNKDAYVTVLNTDPGGETTQLFPNQYQSENLIRANRAVEVPDPDSRSRIVVTGDAGDELLKIVASTSPVSLFEAQQLSGAGAFQVVRTQAERTARSLSVVMGERPAAANASRPAPGSITPVSTGGGAGAAWAVCHQKIKTLETMTVAARLTRSLVVRTNDSGGSVRCEE
jgi:hypothetical protein